MSNATALDLAAIRSNIDRTGLHIYVVSGGPSPRFAYSIGLHESLGFEIVLAGASFYTNEQVIDLLNSVATELKRSVADRFDDISFTAERFSLRDVDRSWGSLLLLGALDFYGTDSIRAVQIVPTDARWTIDVPNMKVPWNRREEPVWKWLVEAWDYPVSRSSTAGTNLAALRGQKITEAMRWEADEWELFAGSGPDTPKEEMRMAPLGTLMASDESLESVVRLSIGRGIWRDEDSEWHEWIVKGQS